MIWLVAAPLGILLYAWIAYPAMLALLGQIVKKNGRVIGSLSLPKVRHDWIAVLISAHNEEAVIVARIANLKESMAELNERETRVFIGIDGATDRTAELAKQAAQGCEKIRVIEFPRRRGKVAVLKDLVEAATREKGEKNGILVFTDANTHFLPCALKRLLDALDDPSVGGASGRLIFRHDGSSNDSPEPLYWDMENRLKMLESALDSCLGANGAIYAIRSELFWKEIPADTIVEDFVLGMKVRELGCKMAYEPEAVAEEDLPPVGSEWGRRVRIGTGDFQALYLCRRCLLPRQGLFAWFFWSHKVLRWFTPHLLLLLLVGAVFCVFLGGAAAKAAGLFGLAGFGAWLLLALIGARAGKRHGKGSRLFRSAWYAALLQTAIFVGFLKFLTHSTIGGWEPTPRMRASSDA